MLPACPTIPTSPPVAAQHVVLRVEGDPRFAICPASVDVLCRRSDYVRALARGGFAESQQTRNRVDAVLPAGLVNGAALARLAEILARDCDIAADSAVALWSAIDFLGIDGALDRARQVIYRALDIWSCASDRLSAADIDPATLLRLYALCARAPGGDGAPQPPDPRATLFSPAAIWCVGCPMGSSHGVPCSMCLARIRPFLALGQPLIQCATDALDGSADEEGTIFVAEDADALSYAATRMLSDWHRCAAAVIKNLRSRLPLGLCDVFALTLPRHLVVARGPHTGVSCFVPLVESFRAALRTDFPRLASVLLDGGWPDHCVALAGGSVVNAMQTEPLRTRLPQSDLDVWVTGRSRGSRKRSFKNLVRLVFDRVPGCRAKIDGACTVTIFPPDAHSATTRPDDPSPTADQPESIQIVLTDYEHPTEIISDFDLDHSCAVFDGHSVRASWACLASIVSRTTHPVAGTETRPSRIDKARRKGFDFADAPCGDGDGGNCDGDDKPSEDVDGHYGRELVIARRSSKWQRVRDRYYDDPHDLLRAFEFMPLVTGSACSVAERPRLSEVGSTRIVWARNATLLHIRPSQVLSACCVPCSIEHQKAEERAKCNHTPWGLAVALDDSEIGVVDDIVEAERVLFAMVSAKSSIFLDASMGDAMAHAARQSAAAVAHTLAAAWSPLIRRTASRATVFGPSIRGQARVHIQCDTQTEARDAVTGRRLDPHLIPVGSYVSAHVVADRVVVNCGFHPRLLALALRVYPPTFRNVMSAAKHV
ncbi:hypothetical protein psal_cds_1366 [Pandoravirus salinus]|uniref:Uncharacterized protein n=1 Tax=Pandoravirus salinus TaxID=1349410 RepID=S4W4V8_9VIRU|nr:hypothetical protein psal_cds_1366 [Pandoravirus salinus]AGO85767.1 hypothetical protein psal_cds_1366 [Pandoravirus salinus]